MGLGLDAEDRNLLVYKTRGQRVIGIAHDDDDERIDQLNVSVEMDDVVWIPGVARRTKLPGEFVESRRTQHVELERLAR